MFQNTRDHKALALIKQFNNDLHNLAKVKVCFKILIVINSENLVELIQDVIVNYGVSFQFLIICIFQLFETKSIKFLIV